MTPTTDRWRLAVFGDEIAADLEDQIIAMRSQSVLHLEFRAAWGINVVDLDDSQLERASQLLREAGMAVSAIGSPVGKAAIDDDFEVEWGRYEAALHAAERLDARLVRVFSFFTGGRYEASRAEVIWRVTAMAREAERRGITLVHENESYIYGDTSERCLDLLQSVDSPALRMAFDPANFVQVGVRPFSEAWPKIGRFVTHMHIKDAVAIDRTGLESYPAAVPGERMMGSVRLPGEGDGQLVELLAELDRTGYDGFLTIEPHLKQHLPHLDGAGRFTAAVEALRRLMRSLDAARQP